MFAAVLRLSESTIARLLRRCGLARLLIKSGHEDEAAARLGTFAARGGDLTGFLWSWLYSGDRGLAERMMTKVKRHLHQHRDDFQGEERKRIERLLTDS
jgi:hypothetical protein